MNKILGIKTVVSKKNGKSYRILTVLTPDGSVGQVFDFSEAERNVGDNVTLKVSFSKDLKPFVTAI